MESECDYRGAVLASREARECLLSANELLARADALKDGRREMTVKIVHIGTYLEFPFDCTSNAAVLGLWNE